MCVCPCSQELNLSGNEIDKIEGLERLHNLRKLTLTTNKITSLAGLAKCENLEHILIQVLCVRPCARAPIEPSGADGSSAQIVRGWRRRVHRLTPAALRPQLDLRQRPAQH